MRQELIFNNRHNGYTVGKHCFQTNKKPVNINEIEIKKKYCYLIKYLMANKELTNTILDISMMILDQCAL